MKAGIVICSRLASTRVPEKAVRTLNGESLIRHLVKRLLKTGLPICVAVPPKEAERFTAAVGRDLSEKIFFLEAWADDPLARMSDAAHWLNLDVVVRVCTDKVFVNWQEIPRFIDVLQKSDLDYVYSSSFVPGTGFEVMRADKLKEAAEEFDNVEHISYAMKAITTKVTDLPIASGNRELRLLIDYHADLDIVEKILRARGNDCDHNEALMYLGTRPELYTANRLPLLTVYTCAYNAKDWITEAMESVVKQDGFERFEYLLVDDGSTDSIDGSRDAVTSRLMRNFSFRYGNVRFRSLRPNVGLASACNVALSEARGEFIVRLDADDYLVGKYTLKDMIRALQGTGFDALYPDHYVGPNKVVQGHLSHHVGGAIFRARALNHMRFTDKLRGYEGYDLYQRAKTQLKIGYYPKPTFFYRQREGSLSKGCPVEREKIKAEIDARTT
jgi:spore coat polysaccharide biosynthesis protein SpsF (cytidylyltransferase family)